MISAFVKRVNLHIRLNYIPTHVSVHAHTICMISAFVKRVNLHIRLNYIPTHVSVHAHLSVHAHTICMNVWTLDMLELTLIQNMIAVWMPERTVEVWMCGNKPYIVYERVNVWTHCLLLMNVWVCENTIYCVWTCECVNTQYIVYECVNTIIGKCICKACELTYTYVCIIFRAGQNRIYTPYMTFYLMVSL